MGRWARWRRFGILVAGAWWLVGCAGLPPAMRSADDIADDHVLCRYYASTEAKHLENYNVLGVIIYLRAKARCLRARGWSSPEAVGDR